MVDWMKALEVFVIGFGGVFLTLIILLTGVVLFSKIATIVTGLTGKSE